jgi:hypothetical protein
VSEQAQEWLGMRWYRRPYQVNREAGLIEPVPGSEAQPYDPFDESAAEQGAPLWQRLQDVKPDDEGSVMRFVNRWGILGLLRHRLLTVTYPQGDNELTIAPEGNHFYTLLKSPAPLSEAMADVEETPGHRRRVAFGAYYAPYRSAAAPDDLLRDGLRWFVDAGDPLVEFRAEVRTFQAMARLCAELATSPNYVIPDVGPADHHLRFGVNRYIHRVRHELVSASGSDPWRPEWKLAWRFPSLLSAAYLGLAMAFTGGHLRRCPACGKAFRTVKRADQVYCGPTCGSRVRQRRLKKGDTP